MGDVPDFEDMSEEERMRWLETLAKRQHAHEGFTTDADMDIPEVDPDTAVVDEPGYTPYSASGESSSAQPPEDDDAVAETPAAQEAPPAQPQPAAPQAQQPAPDDEDHLQGMDPMAFLETLAKRQGAHEGFTTSADLDIPEVDPDTAVVDEPGYTPYYESASSAARQEQAPPQPTPEETPEEAPTYEQPPQPPVQVQEEAAQPPAPLAESPAETGAPEAPVEEPQAQAAPEAPVEPEQPEPEQPATPADPAMARTPADMPAEGELPSEIDPMAFLETLAKRQGATEGFTTAADLDIPEVDPDTAIVDEPGYTPYSATETTGGARERQPAQEQEEAPPQPTPTEPETYAEPAAQDLDEGMLDFEAVPEGLPAEAPEEGWLHDLADEEGADVEDFLDDLAASDAIPDFDEEMEPEADIAADAVDMSAIEGMTDEEIAAAQAAGTITPEQELAWLQSKVSATPDEMEDLEDFEDFDAGPPEPAEVPDWLAAQMPSEEALETVTDDEPADLDVSLEEELDLETLDLGEGELALDLEEALPPGEAPPEDILAEEAPPGDASELLAGYSPEADEWAQAIDEDLQIEDIESVPEPDWYTQAIERADEDTSDLPPELADEALAEADLTQESDLFREQEGDLPDWLQGVETTVVEEDPDLPDWLRAPTGATSDVNEWLKEQQMGAEAAPPAPPRPQPQPEPQPVAADLGLPDEDAEWLSRAEAGHWPGWFVWDAPEEEPAPPPTPAPEAQAPPAPTPTPPATPPATEEVAAPTPPPQRQPEPPAQPEPQPAPEPEPQTVAPAVAEQFSHYHERLSRDPHDHDARLGLARALSRSGELSAGLEEYEVLIEESDQLEQVSADLATLINQLPNHPRARRLLGDVYMRQGRLQEALDTYRGALDRI